MKLIIDSHLDLSWNALGWDRDLTLTLAELNAAEAGMSDSTARGHATTCLPELRAAGVAVCLATLLARVKPHPHVDQRQLRRGLDFGHPAAAHAMAHGQLAYYRLLEDQGEIAFLHTANDLKQHWQRWQQPTRDNLPIGIILAMEGADPIVAPDQADSWWHNGL